MSFSWNTIAVVCSSMLLAVSPGPLRAARRRPSEHNAAAAMPAPLFIWRYTDHDDTSNKSQKPMAKGKRYRTRTIISNTECRWWARVPVGGLLNAADAASAQFAIIAA